eukprot:c38335_g1_i1 orf=16-189(-)
MPYVNSSSELEPLKQAWWCRTYFFEADANEDSDRIVSVLLFHDLLVRLLIYYYTSMG